jgi:hypothetical protein
MAGTTKVSIYSRADIEIWNRNRMVLSPNKIKST